MDEPLPEGIVARTSDVFTEQALRAQDGKRVPLTLDPGGPVVGEAVLKYDPDEKALKAQLQVDDPKVAAFLKGAMPTIFPEGE